MRTIPIIHSFNDCYVIPAAVSFSSMLKCITPQNDTKYLLYVINSDITTSNKQKLNEIVSTYEFAELRFIDLTDAFINETFSKLEIPTHFSADVLFKLKLGSIFAQYDYAIVTDVDVLWKKDITIGFDEFVSQNDHYIAGIHYPIKQIDFLDKYYARQYSEFTETERDFIINHGIGGGYLFYNLKKIRDEGFENKLLDYARKNAHKIPQLEQDVINVCLEAHGYHLPLCHMVCTYFYEHFNKDNAPAEIAEAMSNPVQIHYAGTRKPWNDLTVPFTEDWFKELADTPFFHDYFAQYHELYLKQHPLQKEVSFIKHELDVMTGKKHRFQRLFNISLGLCVVLLALLAASLFM